MSDSDTMITRQSELTRILSAIQSELINPAWVSLVDDDGLMVAIVPEKPPFGSDQIAAMTAAGVMTAKRVLNEFEGGALRFINLGGSQSQLIIVSVDQKRFLSIGLPPTVSAQSTFGPLSKWVPELLATIRKRYSST
jgi:predicted regulator of Ras-like GTPase activity (Roadblock/LC7/MglB family)